MEELKYSYVCYFDILGYKDYFRNGGNKTELLNKIIGSIKLVQDVRNAKSFSNNDENRFKFYVSTFSDNFIFSMPAVIQNNNLFDENNNINPETDKLDLTKELKNLMKFFEILKILQTYFLLNHGLFIRGSIVKGLFYRNENIVYGDALIEAVEIETKQAVYPRIVIQKEILYFLKHFDANDNYYKLLVFDCIDTFGMLNYIVPINIYDCTRKIDKRLALQKKLIESRLLSFGRYDGLTSQYEISIRESVMRKYIWIMNYHNAICKLDIRFLRSTINPVFNFDLKINCPTVEIYYKNIE